MTWDPRLLSSADLCLHNFKLIEASKAASNTSRTSSIATAEQPFNFLNEAVSRLNLIRETGGQARRLGRVSNERYLRCLPREDG